MLIASRFPYYLVFLKDIKDLALKKALDPFPYYLVFLKDLVKQRQWVEEY